MNAEERIEKLEAEIKELKAKNARNTITIGTINYTIELMLDTIENNVNRINQLITIIEDNIV